MINDNKMIKKLCSGFGLEFEGNVAVIRIIILFKF